MPDVEVVNNIRKDIFHVAGYSGMSVWNECGDQKAISQQEVHAMLKCHKFHPCTISSFIPL